MQVCKNDLITRLNNEVRRWQAADRSKMLKRDSFISRSLIEPGIGL